MTGEEGLDPAASDYWARRYAEGVPRWDQGRPAPPLERAIAEADLGPGHRAFVPGCGLGHEALALARRGCRVTAVDFAAAAIDGLHRRARAEGLRVEGRVADIFAPLPDDEAGSYDALVEHTCFCAIPPDRRDDYVRLAARLLRPGGRLLGLFYEVDVPLAEGPPYVTTREDVETHFGPWFSVETLARPDDSFPHRRGREWLGCLRRRADGPPLD